jgi:predicted phage terminase large subunit-like protein
MFDYYLKDALFTRTATKDMYEAICDKIIEHNVILLVIESNVTSELKQNIERILKERGYTPPIIIEKYNTIPKPTRIENEKHIIKKQLVFPQKGMYGVNTDVGRFMDNLTTYNATGTNPNDDAPDSCALFGSEIIEENSQPQKAVPLDFVRQYM